MSRITSYFLPLCLLVGNSISYSTGIEAGNLAQLESDEHYQRIKNHLRSFNHDFYNQYFSNSSASGQETREYCIEAADAFDINPIAVFGAIMGEHSLNQATPAKQLAEQGINAIGSLFGSSGESAVDSVKLYFTDSSGRASYGPGQVQTRVATRMEDRVKRVRGKNANVDKYSLLGACNIIAAYMDHAASAYENKGIDIRDNAPVLVTLYNIGDASKSFKKRAHECRQQINAGERSGPWVNYLGYWVMRNETRLENLF